MRVDSDPVMEAVGPHEYPIPQTVVGVANASIPALLAEVVIDGLCRGGCALGRIRWRSRVS